MTHFIRYRWTAVIMCGLTFGFAAPGEEIHDLLRGDKTEQAKALLLKDPKLAHSVDSYDLTPLHLAAQLGHTEIAKLLLKQGANVNARALDKFIPLHLAKDPEIVRLLIEHKSDLNAKNSSGRTALEEAASGSTYREWPLEDRKRWRQIVQMLLDAGAYYDIRSAIYLADTERVRVLLQNDPKLAHEGSEAVFTFCLATRQGHVPIVKLFLEHKAKANARYQGGNFFWTPLSEGIAHPEVVKLLLEAGADATVKAEAWVGKFPIECSLLHLSAEEGAVGSARQLLAKGIGVDTLDIGRATPLHYAAAGGHVPMVEFLLSNKASVKVRSFEGNTPLHSAASAGHKAVVAVLLDNKADPRSRNDEGWTPMSLAAFQVWPRSGDEEEDNKRYQAVIETLQRRGSPLDLHAAIALGKTEPVAELLKANPALANSKVPLDSGRRDEKHTEEPALHWAVILRRKEIVTLLLDHGADVNARNTRGETALGEAVFWKWDDIAKLLREHKAKGPKSP